MFIVKLRPSSRSGMLYGFFTVEIDKPSPTRHGLSYTTFSLSSLKLSEPSITGSDCTFTATVTVTNTGSVLGSEVVQLYVTLPSTLEYTHPALQLKAFQKVKDLQPGESVDIQISVDKYALSYWDDKISSWIVEKGSYGIQVGVSSDRLLLEGILKVKKGFEWNGL